MSLATQKTPGGTYSSLIGAVDAPEGSTLIGSGGDGLEYGKIFQYDTFNHIYNITLERYT
jgi:hypothetical protein